MYLQSILPYLLGSALVAVNSACSSQLLVLSNLIESLLLRSVASSLSSLSPHDHLTRLGTRLVEAFKCFDHCAEADLEARIILLNPLIVIMR